VRDHALALVLGLLLDALLGDRESWPHPVRFMGAGYSRLERFFRRRGPLTQWQGVLTVFAIGFVSAALPLLSLRWVKSPAGQVLLEGLFFYFCLSVRGLSDEVLAVQAALRAKKLGEARRLLSRVVGRDTKKLSSAEISRAAVETVGESFVDGFLSPLFWGLLLGVPGAFFFKAVSTGDSMIGHPEPPYRKFGWAAAKLDDAMNFIPARLVPFVLVPAVALSRLSVLGLLRFFFRDRLEHASPNAAHGEAAFAGALGVRLGGVNFYEGKVYRQAFLNASGKICSVRDISRGVRLLWMGAAVVMAGLILVGWRLST
jgi:adenosylcobinamide-phosphate synthase